MENGINSQQLITVPFIDSASWRHSDSLVYWQMPRHVTSNRPMTRGDGSLGAIFTVKSQIRISDNEIINANLKNISLYNVLSQNLFYNIVSKLQIQKATTS